MPIKLLISRQDYLASGIHIGMNQRTKDMMEFIYKIRSDGLAILNLRKLDERIKIAAKFLSRSKSIMVVARKFVAHVPANKFAEAVGAEAVVGRFLPGTLTNPKFKKYFEADVIIISDPLIDYQALREAVRARVPIVAICDTFNETKDIDYIIPSNNKGKEALALLFWLLAREIKKERGEIKSDSEFELKAKDFEGPGMETRYQIEEIEE